MISQLKDWQEEITFGGPNEWSAERAVIQRLPEIIAKLEAAEALAKSIQDNILHQFTMGGNNWVKKVFHAWEDYRTVGQ